MKPMLTKPFYFLSIMKQKPMAQHFFKNPLPRENIHDTDTSFVCKSSSFISFEKKSFFWFYLLNERKWLKILSLSHGAYLFAVTSNLAPFNLKHTLMTHYVCLSHPSSFFSFSV
jgi:hypothetical protein